MTRLSGSRDVDAEHAAVRHGEQAGRPTVGKHTLVESSAIPGRTVQRRVDEHVASDPVSVHAAAARGIATPASPLPHGATLQRLFGRHDISSIQAHTGPEAAAATRDMGADAYATGNRVVFGGAPDLHTAAHETAHVVQQRGGVQLHGGVGQAGDAYERHADAVADQVVAGGSAEALLDGIADGAAAHGGATVAGTVQREVKKRRHGSHFVWYSTYDLDQTFEKKSQATNHDAKMKLKRAKQAHHEQQAERDRNRVDEAPRTSEVAASSSGMELDKSEKTEVEIEDDSVEHDAGPSSSSATDTVRAMFLRHMPPRNADNGLALALIVDRVAKDIRETAQFLDAMTESEVASCFDTARRLFDLLGDPGKQTGDWSASVKAGVGIPKLTKDIRASARDAVIYRVGMNTVAHGFTIVVRNGSAELLQGFAGAGGESLAQNIERDGSYSIDTICQLLNGLLDEHKAFEAQNKLFAGSIDIEMVSRDKAKLGAARKDKALQEAHEDEQTNDAQRMFYRDLKHDIFQLEKRALFAPGQLEERIAAKISAGLNALPRKHRPKDTATSSKSKDKQKEKEIA